ncbi:MAG: alpha/beta fold hydrolase [Terriglobales bacterium]
MKIKSNDAEIFYEVRGKGRPLVLLHPFPANHELWLPVADLLATRYQLILPDLRGHGESGVGDGPATMEKHAGDVAAICDAAGVRKAVFAGVSIGGYVLLEFWRRFRERVAALMLLDTRATADTEEGRAGRLKSAEDVEKQGPEPFIDGLIPKLIGKTTRTNRPDLVAAARAMMMKMAPAGIASVQRGMAARPDSTPTLRTIDVPVLLVTGEEDELTPVGDSQFMQQQIPNSKLQVIPRAGHYAIFEQHEDAARIMRQFLEALTY